jgi:hypothetical protein
MSLCYQLYRRNLRNDRGETRIIIGTVYLDNNHVKTIKIVDWIALINKEIHIKKQIILQQYILCCINFSLASNRSQRFQSRGLQIRGVMGVFTALLVADRITKCQDHDLVPEWIHKRPR